MDTINLFLYLNEEEESSNRKESRKAVRNLCQDIFQLSDTQ